MQNKEPMSKNCKRFVIQEHSISTGVHWDFMFESDNTLKTYRLDKSPEDILQVPANAIKIFDHPLKFLTYQGTVNKGQGHVYIVEAGTFKILQNKHDLIQLSLNGQILKGKFVLTHIKGHNWLLSS